MPDCDEGKYPEKDFFWGIMATTYTDETNDLIYQARSSRAITNAHEDMQKVEIISDLK